MWLVYSDWILSFRKPLYNLGNGIMSKNLRSSINFYKLSIIAPSTNLHSSIAHLDIKQVNLIFSFSPFLSQGRLHYAMVINLKILVVKTTRLISCSHQCRVYWWLFYSGSPTGGDTESQVASLSCNYSMWYVAPVTKQEETAGGSCGMYLQSSSWMAYVTSAHVPWVRIQASDPQPNYKEVWEEWSLPAFPGRGNGVVNT